MQTYTRKTTTVQAKIVKNTITDRPKYRIFSDAEITRWEKANKLPLELAKEAENVWADVL